MIKRSSVLFGLMMVLGMGVLAAPSVRAADDSPRPKAKKEKKAKESPKKAASDEAVPAADSGDIDQKLADARDERDRSLDQAAQEKDPVKVEQKKREIFAKYAAICAALRDAAAKGESTASASPDPAPAKSRNTGKTKSEPAKAEAKTKSPAERLDDLRSQLSAVEQKLSDLSAQHDAKLDTLQQKLDDVKAGGKPKAIDKAQAAVDKENAVYAAKKSDLDSQKGDLQKQIDVLAPPPPPATKK